MTREIRNSLNSIVLGLRVIDMMNCEPFARLLASSKEFSGGDLKVPPLPPSLMAVYAAYPHYSASPFSWQQRVFPTTYFSVKGQWVCSANIIPFGQCLIIPGLNQTCFNITFSFYYLPFIGATRRQVSRATSLAIFAKSSK